MSTMRNSSATKPNPELRDTAADQSTARSLAAKAPTAQTTSNLQWLKATGITDGILLLGGTSLAHFRVRVAQGHLRSDLLPSYWSLVGLLVGEQLVSVPLDSLDETSLVPLANGVQSRPLTEYDDTTKFPNIAVLQFTLDTNPVVATVERIKRQRSIIDLPTLIISWLSFIWGAGAKVNPLTVGMGLPSAAFTETAYGMAGVELAPGLSSSASCPEAIWQSAKWWHDFYAKPEGIENADHARSIVPKGTYAIRQPAAAAIGPKDEKRGDMIVARDEPSARTLPKRNNLDRKPRSKKKV
jgi:hypothetical protein